MKKYITIEVHTIKGLRRAERYYARGWKIYRSGPFTVTLSKTSA
jgi:hypothetical protein